MPSKSKQQQKFMGIVRSIQKGDQPASKFSKKAQDAADDMKEKDVEKFASTKHKGLPKKVEQALREKIRTMVEDYVESCGYVVSAKDPNYKLKSPGGTGEEDRELKEEGFGSDEFLTKTEKKKFEKERLENAEVLGYTLTGTKDLKESVNESKKEKDQIIRYLQGLGFNERTAKKAVAKSYNYISKAYRNTGTRYKGDLIARILNKKESVNEADARNDKSIGTKNYKGVGWFWPSDSWKHYLRDTSDKGRKLVHDLWLKAGFEIKKNNRGIPGFDIKSNERNKAMKIVDMINKKMPIEESMNPRAVKKMRDEFEKTGQLPPHLKRFALDLKILKKKHKVKNIVVPGLEWMSDMKENINEDGHTDVPSAVRKLKTSIEDASQIIGYLKKVDDTESLPSWWTNKVTLSANYLNTARDYILNPHESINEMSAKSKKVINKLGKKEKEVFLTMVDMLGFDQVMSDYKRDKKAFKQALKDMTESVFAVRQDKIKNGERFPKEPNFDYDPEKGKSRIRKVNEGKGVDKIMKMADDYSYGKIAGKTVDVMTAKLFQAVYKKASQKARDRVDKMNEKQLYIFMMNLWKKFGKQLRLSS